MRQPVSGLLTLLAVLTVLGCPLDIQVRSEETPDAGCQGDACELACASDAQCPAGQRCDDFYGVCEPGPRLTEACSGFGSCSEYASCEDGRCQQRCVYGCPLGYQCSPAPESVCVEECTAGPPETLGDFCQTSLDCTRCGFCVAAGGTKRCHQPCRSDAECPGGEAGGCQLVAGSSSLRVCRLP